MSKHPDKEGKLVRVFSRGRLEGVGLIYFS